MNKFIGLVVLGCAFVIGFGSIAGCPKKDAKKDDTKKDEAKKDDAKKDDKATTTTTTKVDDKKDAKIPEKKLTVNAVKGVSIKQGATESVTISVTRDNLPDMATIKIDDLPAGVTVSSKELTIAAKSDSATVTLKAADDAKETTTAHKAKLTVSSGDITSTTELMITVTKK